MFQGSNNPHEEGSSQTYVGKGWVSRDCGFENSSLLPTTAQGNIILSSSGEAQRTQAKAFSSQEKLSTKPNNLANSSIQQNSNTETSDLMQYVEPFSLFQDLKRESASRRGKLLGLFIGTKYITTSISVKNQFEAASHLSYHHKDSSMDSLAQVLQDLILKHEIRGIIIGNSACDVLDAIIAGRELDNEELMKETWDDCYLPKYARRDYKKRMKYTTREAEKNAAIGVLESYFRQMNIQEQRPSDWYIDQFD